MELPARWLPLMLKAGVALMILAALMGRSEHRAWLYWGFALASSGVGALWGLSAAGGFGGDTGRSNLWWLALVPYPVGWMLALVGGIKAWRDGLPRLAVESP